jgi:hypothetical protein
VIVHEKRWWQYEYVKKLKAEIREHGPPGGSNPLARSTDAKARIPLSVTQVMYMICVYKAAIDNPGVCQCVP